MQLSKSALHSAGVLTVAHPQAPNADKTHQEAKSRSLMRLGILASEKARSQKQGPLRRAKVAAPTA